MTITAPSNYELWTPYLNFLVDWPTCSHRRKYGDVQLCLNGYTARNGTHLRLNLPWSSKFQINTLIADHVLSTEEGPSRVCDSIHTAGERVSPQDDYPHPLLHGLDDPTLSSWRRATEEGLVEGLGRKDNRRAFSLPDRPA